MDANLVRAPGVQIGFDERERAEAQPRRANPCARRGLLGDARSCANGGADRARRADQCVPASPFIFPCRSATYFSGRADREILPRASDGPRRSARRSARRKFLYRADARCRGAAGRQHWKVPDSAEAVQKSGNQRAGIRAGTGMNDHSSGLVDDGEIRVLIENSSGIASASTPGGRRGGNLDRQRFARLRCDARLCARIPSTCMRPSSMSDWMRERLSSGSCRDEEAVEPLAGVFGSHDEFQ